MENTNNLNQVKETNDIKSITDKSSNIFKFLFLITFIILIGTIIASFLLIKKNKQKSINLSSRIEILVKERSQTTSTPTLAPTPTTEYPITEENKKYKVFSIQDDVNSISRLILKDKDNSGKETVINEFKYWKLTDETNAPIAKPSYQNFIFSPDNNFLYYLAHSGWEASSPYLYNIKNKKNVNISFFSPDEESFGFTSDSKYFYACSEGGMMGGGVVVFDLVQNKNIFLDEDEGFKCKYDDKSEEIKIFSYDETEKNYSKVKYTFSQATGKLSEMK